VGKKEYLIDELGPHTVELMKTVKKAVDPLNIMNPGKVRAYFLCPNHSSFSSSHSVQLYPDDDKK